MVARDSRRYSKVSRRVWNDARFRSLSAPAPNGQTLWLRLLTGPELTVIPGVIPAGEAGLAEAIGWDLEGFREAFREVFREGLAEADWKARLIWVPKAIEHNDPESPNVVKSWAIAWDEVPECDLKSVIWQALHDHMQAKGGAWFTAFSEACPKPFGKPSPKPSFKPSVKAWANQEQEQEQEQEEDTSSLRSEVCAESAEPTHAPHQAPKREVRIDPVVMEFPVDGNAKEPTWQLRASKVAEWSKSFPSLDVTAQLRLARQWILDNPSRRKTAGGMPRFLGSWLSRAQNQGPPQPHRSGSGAPRAAPAGLVTSPWPDETRPHGASRSTGKGWEQWDANAKLWRPMTSATSAQPQPQSGAVA